MRVAYLAIGLGCALPSVATIRFVWRIHSRHFESVHWSCLRLAIEVIFFGARLVHCCTQDSARCTQQTPSTMQQAARIAACNAGRRWTRAPTSVAHTRCSHRPTAAALQHGHARSSAVDGRSSGASFITRERGGCNAKRCRCICGSSTCPQGARRRDHYPAAEVHERYTNRLDGFVLGYPPWVK